MRLMSFPWYCACFRSSWRVGSAKATMEEDGRVKEKNKILEPNTARVSWHGPCCKLNFFPYKNQRANTAGRVAWHGPCWQVRWIFWFSCFHSWSDPGGHFGLFGLAVMCTVLFRPNGKKNRGQNEEKERIKIFGERRSSSAEAIEDRSYLISCNV